MFNGQLRRIDLAYPDAVGRARGQGLPLVQGTHDFDRDALRGNELQLAGFRVLSFTSAFTDWEIACQIAEALELPQPSTAAADLRRLVASR